MDYIQGVLLEDASDDLSYEQKVIIGKNIRKITDNLNVNVKHCGNFVSVDVLEYAKASKGWLEEGFPESFETERQAYLSDFHISEQDKVYCHGDFHIGNLLVDDDLNVYVIDFASAMHAPFDYELSFIVSSLFCCEKPYIEGYFGGDYSVDDMVDLCMTWLPVHAWGYDSIMWLFEPAEDIISFSVLRERLHDLMQREKQKPLL